MSAWTFLVLTIGAAVAPFLPIGQAVARDAWTAQHFQDHPLAGTIWTSDLKPVTVDELEEALANARFVLLGEIHDNPDHHRLQARLIEGLVRNGRRPAIVFEMVPPELQAELDHHVQGGASDAGALGKALHWEERGWPAWSIYQPVAEAALRAGLPLKAGGLGRDVKKALSEGEASPTYTQTIQDLDLARPLKTEAGDAQAAEIKEGHCNLLPEAALAPMMTMQRALDSSLAKALRSGDAAAGAVLIAGAGHVRNDWGVAHIIRQKAPSATVVSVAFSEVDPDRTRPSAYMKTVPGLEKPFDFIYFTPRADLTDHCAEIEKHMKSKKTGNSRER